MPAIDFAAFVNELATVSGETILPFFRTALTIEDKGRGGSFDPVTAADHAAETAMRALIRRTFPDHGIIGEEYGQERADAEYVWVLDPIDGTKSFISGMPGLGHADRPAAVGRAGVRNDEPAVHPRALQRRRRRGALSRSGRRARSAGAPVREAVGSGPVHHQPAADERRRPQQLRPGRGRGAALALRRRLLRLLHAGGGPWTSSSKPSSSLTTCCRWSRSSPGPAA